MVLLLALAGCSSDNTTPASLRFSPANSVVTETDNVEDLTLTLENVGGTSVTIDRIRTSCGCTLPQGFTTTVLPPGESTSISLRVNLPSSGQQTVTVRAETTPPIDPLPSAVLLLDGGEPPTPSIRRLPNRVVIRGDMSADRAASSFTITTVENPDEPRWIKR